MFMMRFGLRADIFLVVKLDTEIHKIRYAKLMRVSVGLSFTKDLIHNVFCFPNSAIPRPTDAP